MINKYTEKIEENQSPLSLFPLSNKSVELKYSLEDISSDGGLLLLREVDKQLGLITSISQSIVDQRDKRYIDHGLEEMLAQRVYQIAAGYEDCNDCNEMRKDGILKMCAGRLPIEGKDLASQPTMSRLENSVNNRDLYRMGKVLLDVFIRSYAKAPKRIILDCDDTNNLTYGGQQLSLFNNYYHGYCYMPLHIYEGMSGKLITTILRPGRRNKQAGVCGILKKIIKYIKKQWPKTLIIIRGDSHFSSPDFMEWCDQRKRIYFITGLSGNQKLHKLAAISTQSAQREYAQSGKKVKRYHSFDYKAGSWKHPQRVIVKVEVCAMGTNIRYIVSNITNIRAKQLYENAYCARGAMELLIKEHKLYLKSDRSSCSKFSANQFRLFLHSMAYILIHSLQKEVLAFTEFANSTMQSIQLKIIKTAARIKELKTKIKIEFPVSCSSKLTQQKAFLLFETLRC